MKSERTRSLAGRNGVTQIGDAVGKFEADDPSDEECLRQLDTLHLLSTAIAGACADLRAILALNQASRAELRDGIRQEKSSKRNSLR